ATNSGSVAPASSLCGKPTNFSLTSTRSKRAFQRNICSLSTRSMAQTGRRLTLICCVTMKSRNRNEILLLSESSTRHDADALAGVAFLLGSGSHFVAHVSCAQGRVWRGGLLRRDGNNHTA